MFGIEFMTYEFKFLGIEGGGVELGFVDNNKHEDEMGLGVWNWRRPWLPKVVTEKELSAIGDGSVGENFTFGVVSAKENEKSRLSLFFRQFKIKS